MLNIAITGVGGGVGQSIIKSLFNTEYNLVTLDADPLAVGLYSANKSYIIPLANDLNYIQSLLNICEFEKIDILFPGLDAELMPLSKNKEKFEKIGTNVIVSNSDVIAISDNKLETYTKLTSLGFNVPFTLDLNNYEDFNLGFPLIIKPKIGGASSKNVYKVANEKEFKNIIDKIENEINEFIIQEYIEGDEYTCGTINLNNKCNGVIVMKRILRHGDTYKSFTIKNEIIENEVYNLVEKIKPFGACNIQLRMRNNIPHIFEINARCSGTTAQRTMCGFNEPKMIADYLLRNIEPSFSISEKTILRYWNEIEVNNEVLDNLINNGVTINENIIKL